MSVCLTSHTACNMPCSYTSAHCCPSVETWPLTGRASAKRNGRAHCCQRLVGEHRCVCPRALPLFPNTRMQYRLCDSMYHVLRKIYVKFSYHVYRSAVHENVDICRRTGIYCMYKALRSADGFRHSLSLSRGRIEQTANEAVREIHDFRCKLTSCKCQELHAPGKQPGRRMHVRNRKDGEKER